MIRRIAMISLFLFAVAASAHAEAIVGKKAPSISLMDSDGKTVKLEDYKGKYVVLEWVNFSCPFVKRQYGTGNMQRLQKEFTEKGVVWLSICSSAEGKQGYMTADEAKTISKERNAVPTDLLLDPAGVAGKAYGAKTTPHMFVIDPKGKVLYNGAIDDKPSADPEEIPPTKSYVATALDQAMSGKKVAVAVTQSYGCSVKY
ncbi:MAG: thioredoxin family protein [Candidatus Eiseniibacteriota bacterium]